MLPDIKIAHLRTFITVAEYGNFRRAASVLCRTQPAVSLSIKQLEQLLGAALFDKQKPGQLTAFGANFLPQAKSLYQHYQDTLNNALEIAQAQTGSVRLGVLPSIAKHFLSDIIQTFMAKHPQVELQVQDDNGDNLRAKLLAGQIDIAISSIWQQEPDLVHTPLCQDAVGIVGLTTHACVQADKAITAERLASSQLIRNGTTPLIAGSAVEAFMQAPVQVSNMASLEATLSAGAGITTLPWLAYPRDNQKLAFRVLDQARIQRRIALLRWRQAQQLPATEALEKVIINYFKDRAVENHSPYLRFVDEGANAPFG